MPQIQSIVNSGESQLGKWKENSTQQIAYYKSIAETNELLKIKE